MILSPFKLQIHHIGGRDGEIGEFPLNRYFLNDILFHIYDSDEACVPQIEKICRLRHLNFKIHPCVVDDREGMTEFKLNHCPCTSSLLPPAQFKPDQYSPSSLLGDYIYKDAFKPVSTLEVPSVTLDMLAIQEGHQIDMLSIDTQGSEVRVMHGAEKQLLENTVAVLTEVELHEIYQDQPLFGDVHAEMRKHGFHFMRFITREARVNFFRAGIGFRGDGMLMSADGLFFRDPEHIEANAASPFVSLVKLAFIALSFEYVEFALDCLHRAMSRPDAVDINSDDMPAYCQFLAETWRQYNAAPFIPQPSFADLFTVEEALRRFDPDIPHAWSTFDRDRALKTYLDTLDIEAFQRTLPILLSDSDTEFEILLRKNGMEAVADTVQEKRLKHAGMTVECLGLGKRIGPRYRLNLAEELQRLGYKVIAEDELTPEEIRAESRRLSLQSGWEGGPSEGWQFPFDLGHGIVTTTYTEVQAELHPWRQKVLLDNLDTIFARRYENLSVLDLGACEGAMALALWEKGVRDITCVEARASNVEKARFVFKVKKAKILVVEQDVQSFLEQNTRQYDLVLFMGLLYHLLDPFLIMNLTAKRTRGTLAMETVIAQPHDLRFDNVDHYSPSPEAFFIRHDSAFGNNAGLSDLELWPNYKGLEMLLTEVGYSDIRKMDYGSTPNTWYDTQQRAMVLASKT